MRYAEAGAPGVEVRVDYKKVRVDYKLRVDYNPTPRRGRESLGTASLSAHSVHQEQQSWFLK
jgi:hypothetical protein